MRFLCLLLVACSTPTPCEPQDLVDCPTCSGDEARHAIMIPGTQLLHVFAAGDGKIVCPACASVWTVEPGALTAATIDDGPRTEITAGAGAPDGTVYVVADQAPPPQDEPGGPGPMRTSFELVAIASSGAVAWRAPLDLPPLDHGYELAYQLVAGPEGPYLVTRDDFGATAVAALGPDGATRWTQALRGEVTPDGRGNLYVTTPGFHSGPGTATAQLALLDTKGMPLRSRNLTATGTALDRNTQIVFSQLAATDDGGVMIVGELEGDMLDFGNFKLAPARPQGSNFVAAIDPSGKTRWAYAFDALGNLAIAASGQTALVSGDYNGDGGSLGLPRSQDADVAVVAFDATGAHPGPLIHGRGSQTNVAIAAAPDGAAWVSVYDTVDLASSSSSELVVGSNTFDTGKDGWGFVFELAR